jgi:hypothetical protein
MPFGGFSLRCQDNVTRTKLLLLFDDPVPYPSSASPILRYAKSDF